MSRSIGITDAETTTAFRAVGEYLVDGERRLTYAGLHDRVGPAKQAVTWWRNNPGYMEWKRSTDVDVKFVDAWVEPVTVTNHPGVRYEDGWMAPEDDTRERLHAISALASASEDGPENPWMVAYATRRLADGDFTVAQAREWLGEGWESL